MVESRAAPVIVESCARCGRPRAGIGRELCDDCADAVSAGGGVGPGRLAKRVLAVAATAGVLVAWWLLLPSASWTRTGVLVYGTICVVSLGITWVMSGELIER